MALKKNISLSLVGIDGETEGYISITSISFILMATGDEKAPVKRLVAGVSWHASKNARDMNLPMLFGESIVIDGYDSTISANIHTAIYNHLKTLPRYAGAVDA